MRASRHTLTRPLTIVAAAVRGLRPGARAWLADFIVPMPPTGMALVRSEQFEREGIRLRSLQDGIDPTSVMGKAMQIGAAFAKVERNLLRERTKAGLAAARARGRLAGRKPRLKLVDGASRERRTKASTPSAPRRR